MSWLSMVLKTYDNSPHLWGKRGDGDPPDRIPLLLIGQSTQNAQIEVVLNQKSEIEQARAITEKSSRMTVIPCTGGSIGRTGSKIAAPLHDKLQYVAGTIPHSGRELMACVHAADGRWVILLAHPR